jgi:hypothetical protein
MQPTNAGRPGADERQRSQRRQGTLVLSSRLQLICISLGGCTPVPAEGQPCTQNERHRPVWHGYGPSDSVDAAFTRLEGAVAQRGLTVFARLDFAADAAAAGLTLPSTRLLLFGNPRAGTPLMAAAPTAALDLPLKVLIWEVASGACPRGHPGPGHSNRSGCTPSIRRKQQQRAVVGVLPHPL